VKRIFGFGTFSDNSICMGILITSVLIIFRFIYFSRFGIYLLQAVHCTTTFLKNQRI